MGTAVPHGPTNAHTDGLTINEAAHTTGWSARMLRYIESVGLVEPRRSASGYRLYGPGELQRLSSLRELLHVHGLELAEVGFARRLHVEPRLRAAIERWLSARAQRPKHVVAADWLRFEQEKHQRLISPAGPMGADARTSRCGGGLRDARDDHTTTTMETTTA